MEEKKIPRLKHVTPLNLSGLSPRARRKRAPLSGCDCDNYTCNCDHSTDICGVEGICAAENVDVDACGIWG